MSSDSRAQALAKRLRGIREPRQRVIRLVARLAEMAPVDIADFLNDLILKAGPESKAPAQLHLDLVRHRDVLSLLGYETLADVYAEAHARDLTDVKSLLRSDRSFAEEFEEKPETFAGRLDALTLGERKQLGRYAERAALEALLFDPDPMVIRELLLNPHVTERDVVRIATRHRAPPAVLEEILKSDKWTGSYRVRKALVFNPGTPHAYACGLAAHLQRQDLLLLIQIRPGQKELCAVAKKRLAGR